MCVNSNKKIKAVYLFIVLYFAFVTLTSPYLTAAIIEPNLDQYLEYKVVSVEDVEGKDKQAIVELWAYNIEFTAVDLNLYYDNTKVKPSDMETNDYIDSVNATDNNMFTKADEFSSSLDVWLLNYTSDWLEYIYGVMLPESGENPHLYTGTNSNNEEYVSIRAGSDGVLLGKFSYRLFNGKIDNTTFRLKQTEYQSTGIQLVVDNVDECIDSQIIKFTLNTESDNAYLIDLKFDNETVEGFNKETLVYEKTILEEKESIRLLPVREEETSTIEVIKQIPDTEGEGGYTNEAIELDEETNDYEVPLEELGVDTKIQIRVTAEDQETVKVYELTIKRPCGVIRGSIITLSEQHIYVASVKVYLKGQIDWQNLTNHDELPEPIKEINSSDEVDSGAFEIKLIPGEYDILIDKIGYLDYIYTNIFTDESNSIDLGQINLVAGDTNKDGIVDLADLLGLNSIYGSIKDVQGDYGLYADFNEDDIVNLADLLNLNSNYYKMKTIN